MVGLTQLATQAPHFQNIEHTGPNSGDFCLVPELKQQSLDTGMTSVLAVLQKSDEKCVDPMRNC